MSTKDRRPLIEGLAAEPEVDPKAARDFVFQKKANTSEEAPAIKLAATPRLPAGGLNPSAQAPLIPLTARIPAEKFQALKRASFERQLQGIEPSSMQDIVEEALTPWLRKHGYLP